MAAPLNLLGEECDIDINECDSNPCHHAGTCLDQPNGYTCHCPHGWVGANCEIRKCFCSSATAFQCHIVIHKKTIWLCPASPLSLTGVAVRPREVQPGSPVPPESQGHIFAHHMMLLPLLPESESTLPLGWKCASVIRSSLPLIQPKNVFNRKALESYQKIESLWWNMKEHTECKFTSHLCLQVSSNVLVSISCLERSPVRMSISKNLKNTLSHLDLSIP